MTRLQWQLHWPSWYKLRPWWDWLDDHEFGIRDYYFGFGPFQFRWRTSL